MSYDLHAFRVPPGRTAEDWYHDEERERASELRAPTVPEREAMERLAAAVLALDPSAQRNDVPTHIEITNANAVQVSIFHEDAAITVPYWYEGDKAHDVLIRMHEYAEVLTAHGGLSVYDPQTGQVVSGPGAQHAYDAGVEATKRIAAQYEPPNPAAGGPSGEPD